MGLISCPDCSHTISDQAPACPMCGRPINDERPSHKKKFRWWLWPLIVIGVIWMLIFPVIQQAERNKQQKLAVAEKNIAESKAKLDESFKKMSYISHESTRLSSAIREELVQARIEAIEDEYFSVRVQKWQEICKNAIGREATQSVQAARKQMFGEDDAIDKKRANGYFGEAQSDRDFLASSMALHALKIFNFLDDYADFQKVMKTEGKQNITEKQYNNLFLDASYPVSVNILGRLADNHPSDYETVTGQISWISPDGSQILCEFKDGKLQSMERQSPH